MVCYYGMSPRLANISYYDSSGQTEYAFSKPYSEETARAIDEETQRLIGEAYAKAKEILTKYQEQHHQLANLLLEREVLFAEDLERILGPRPGGKLENAGIEAVLMNKQDSSYLFGDIEVYVHQHESQQALNIVNSHEDE